MTFRKILFALFCAGAMLSAVAAPATPAAPTAPATPAAPADEPREVTAAFWKALCAGDRATVERLAVGKPEKIAKVLADIAEIKKAADGDAEAAKTWKAFTELKFTPSGITGDRAVVYAVAVIEIGGRRTEEKLDSPVVLRRVGGKWRVDVDATDF